MSQIKVNGAVVREVPTGEGDRVITVLAEKIGKIYVYVNGARRTRSRISAATDFLAWSEFVLFQKGGKYRLNSCEIIESFYALREDIVNLTYASHIAEIVTDMFQEEQENDELLRLYLNTLSLLTKKKKSAELLASVFAFRAACICGYMPILDRCAVCGGTVGLTDDTENSVSKVNVRSRESVQCSFSIQKNGIVCEKCLVHETGNILIGPGALRALIYIAFSEENRVFSFDASGEVLHEIDSVASSYIESVNEKSYKKLEYLRKL